MTNQSSSTESEKDSEQLESAISEQELWPSPGKILKKMREDLGYSPEKVSESLYITAHYVKALEDDNYEKLPGHTFIKGYYKAYAEFIGADTEKILSCYVNYLENSNQQDTQEVDTDEIKSRNKTILWASVGVVLIVLIAGGIWMSSANALPHTGVMEQTYE